MCEMAPSMARTWKIINRISCDLPQFLQRCTVLRASPLVDLRRTTTAFITGQRSIWQCASRLAIHQPQDGATVDGAEEKEPEFFTPVSIESAEQEALLLARPSSQPQDSRISKVAIIGTPNAGKSTLINSLLGRRICAVSEKVHTTRTKALAVITRKSTQVVLLDTPGLISFSSGRRHKLARSLLVDAKNTLLEADLIAVLVDVSNKWTNVKLDPEVLLQLHTHPEIPSILVLNKVDGLQSKHSLFEITELLTEGVVDGKDFVSSRRRKGHSKERRLPNADRTGLSNDSDEHTEETLLRDETLEDSPERTAERVVGMRPETAEGYSTLDGRRSQAAEANPHEGADGSQSTLQRNAPSRHSHLARTQEEGSGASKEGGVHHVSGHMTHENPAGSGDLDPAKADILKQYSDNLMEFVDPSEGTVLDFSRTMDGNGDDGRSHAVARQQQEEHVMRKEEMEERREERRRLWRLAKEKSGWPGFRAVYMISALYGDGVQDLKEFLLNNARPGDWEYHEDVVTNLTPEDIVKDAIREKLLQTLPQEVPYNITQSTELWQTGEDGELHIVQAVICKKKSHLRMLEKKAGWIARQATQDLMDAFHCDVKLRLHLKISK